MREYTPFVPFGLSAYRWMQSYGKEAKNPFKWTKGSFDETAKYIWNTKQATYHFCPTCSILILWNGLGGIVGVNIRCFDDFSKIDLDNFKMVKANGAKDVPGEAPAKVLKRLAGMCDLSPIKD